MPEIALVYHLNLHHYSLTPTMQKFLINHCLGKMISSIRVPVNFSLTSEDLETIKNCNPKIYQLMILHPYLKFLCSIYSHALISDFPQDLELQLNFGLNLQKQLIPPSKLLLVGAFPEYDYLGKKTSLIQKMWQFCLVNHTIIKHPPSGECSVIYRLGHKNLSSPAYLLCVHKNTNYRRYYHQYLREKSSVKEVINSLSLDSKQYLTDRSADLLISHVDFEPPLFNQVYFDNWKTDSCKVSPPRIFLFQNLQRQLELSKLKFIFLDSKTVSRIADKSKPVKLTSIVLEGRKSKKAQTMKQQLLRKRNQLLEISPMEYLSCTTSDFFVYNHKKLILESRFQGRRGKVIIKRSGNWENTYTRKLKNMIKMIS